MALFCIMYLVTGLSPSQESKLSAITSSLRSCRPSVYHAEERDSRKVPFPTAQQANLQACSPHSPHSAERQIGKQRISGVGTPRNTLSRGGPRTLEGPQIFG